MTSPQLSKRENYNILDNLGKGAFGIVSKIEIKDDKKVYALKQIFFPGDRQFPEAIEEAKKEYAILNKDLKNVVRSYGSFYDPKTKCFSFSMNLCKYNLDGYIEEYLANNNSNIPFEKFLSIFRDIITGKKKIVLKT